MKLYLDDDHDWPYLAGKLHKEGHDVQRPGDVALSGSHDALHLLHAIQEGRVLLSGNRKDFEALHKLVLGLGNHHPGILLVCRESNPSRNMKPPDIVRAVTNLEAANVPLADQVHILNHWR